jgi:hypothetical protein
VPGAQQSLTLGKDGRRWRQSPTVTLCRVPNVCTRQWKFSFFSISLPSAIVLTLGKDSTCNYMFNIGIFLRIFSIFLLICFIKLIFFWKNQIWTASAWNNGI